MAKCLTQPQKLTHEVRIVQAFVSSTLTISIVNKGFQQIQTWNDFAIADDIVFSIT